MPRKRRDRFRKQDKRRDDLEQSIIPVVRVKEKQREAKSGGNFFYNLYDMKYKTLLLIPMAMLLIAVLLIGFKVATTGDFLNRGVSLKGGVTMTIISAEDIDTLALQNALLAEFPGEDISVRSLESSGNRVGVLIEAGIEVVNQEDVNRLTDKVAGFYGKPLSELEYSVEVMGSALGESFFKQTFIAILIAFVFMALVVWYYFRIPIPSLAVILAAFSDMVVTLAIVNLMGMKLSTAGIAAFLMLIGYSVDTDILLSTRVLKRSGGTVLDRTLGAMKTGLTMNLTTMAAVIVALILSKSEILNQIMTILLIGLIIDIINTWIQNAGILRWYLEKHHADIKKLE